MRLCAGCVAVEKSIAADIAAVPTRSVVNRVGNGYWCRELGIMLGIASSRLFLAAAWALCSHLKNAELHSVALHTVGRTICVLC